MRSRTQCDSTGNQRSVHIYSIKYIVTRLPWNLSAPCTAVGQFRRTGARSQKEVEAVVEEMIWKVMNLRMSLLVDLLHGESADTDTLILLNRRWKVFVDRIQKSRLFAVRLTPWINDYYTKPDFATFMYNGNTNNRIILMFNVITLFARHEDDGQHWLFVG